MIVFSCHNCSKEFTVKDSASGKRAKCPKCETIIFVPAPPAIPLPSSQVDDADFSIMRDKHVTTGNTDRSRCGYVRSNLLRDEVIIYTAKQHWFSFVAPAFNIGMLPLLFLLFYTIGRSDYRWRDMIGGSDNAFIAAMLVTSIVGLPVLLVTIERYLQYESSEFAVTNQRVILKAGSFQLRVLELFHNKIDALAVEQGLFGQLFDFGSVYVSVATEKQHFPCIANPFEFRRQVQSQLESLPTTSIRSRG